ncbi:hypothetical protein BDW69DRAFT_86738 [Aspergillus filifer]
MRPLSKSVPSPHVLLRIHRSLSRSVTWLTFDLRKYLPKSFNTADYAASYCLGHIPWNIELPASFIDIAQELNESYRNTFQDDSQFIRLVPHLDQIAFNARRTALAQGFAIRRTTAINSIGIVDRYIQHTYGDIVTVQDVALNCDFDIGPSFFFFHYLDFPRPNASSVLLWRWN